MTSTDTDSPAHPDGEDGEDGGEATPVTPPRIIAAITALTTAFTGAYLMTGLSYAWLDGQVAGLLNGEWVSIVFGAVVLGGALALVGAVLLLSDKLGAGIAQTLGTYADTTRVTAFGTATGVLVQSATFLSREITFTVTQLAIPSGAAPKAITVGVTTPLLLSMAYSHTATHGAQRITTAAEDDVEDGNGLTPEEIREATTTLGDDSGPSPDLPGVDNNDTPTYSNTGPSPNNNTNSGGNHNDVSESQGGDGAGYNVGEYEYNWQGQTDVSFEDIGGMEQLKNTLRNNIIRPLEDKERAEELGVNAPNIIFHGPPGTGKTYMAKALATELGLPFAKLSGADLQSKWINESAGKVNQLFTEAFSIAEQGDGAVVFLDELDTVLKDRGSASGSHDEDRKVVNEFLNHLEETKDHDVVFIGATNRVDALDDAGIRSGRIDEKIQVGEPDREARKAILEQQLGDRGHELTGQDIQFIAGQTDGLVAADLAALVESAAKRTFNRGGDTITMSDMESAVNDSDLVNDNAASTDASTHDIEDEEFGGDLEF